MASGSFTGSTNNQYITPRILWSSTANTTANTSNVTVTLQLMKSSSSSSSTYGTGAWTVNINGTTYNFSSTVTIPANSTYITVYTKTVNNIAHNNDGTKSIYIGWTGGISGTTYTSTSISNTIALDSIARASTVSSFSFTNGYIDQGIDVTISAKSSSYYHDIHLYLPDTSGTGINLINSTVGRKAGGTHHINFTASQLQTIYSAMSSKTSSKFTVYVLTYANSTTTTSIGDWQIATATGNISTNVKPTISAFTATVASGGLGGLYVQGKSTVKLTCSATMGSGASVTSYAFSGPGINTRTTNNNVTSTILTSSGTLTYKVTVTDSRGRKAESSVQIYVYPYSNPKITSITAQRCLADGTLDNNGTYSKVTVKTAHSAANAKNTAKVTLTNSKDGSTATQIISSTNESNTYSGVYGSNFNINTSYTITATITDSYNALGALSATLRAAQRALNIAKYGNGLAIGALSTVDTANADPKFECGWDTTFTRAVRINDTAARSFELNRFNVADDVDNDGTNETVDIRAQFFVDDDGSITIRRRYSLDGSISHTTQGYIQLRNEDFYVNDPITATSTITAPRARFTAPTDAALDAQNNVALRIGNDAADHIDIDGNEIIAKDSPTTLGTLALAGAYVDLYAGSATALRMGTDTTGAYMQSAPTYNRTYAIAPNMYMTSSGTFGRSTSSSERYKVDIADVTNDELDPYKILDIPVRQFKYNEDNIPIDRKPDDLYIGLIAEEVNRAYPAATEYTEDGQIEMWNINVLFPALLKIVQDQQKEIEALKEQINNKAVN